MDGALANVSSFAIWGSLLAQLVLGVYMLVQGLLDKEKGRSYGFFCVVISYRIVLDGFHPFFDVFTYEFLRLFWFSGFVAAVMELLSFKRRRIAFTFILLTIYSSVIFYFKFNLATTALGSVSYSICAYLFFRRYIQQRGYASLVLGTFLSLIALSCSFFFFVVKRSPSAANYGYVNYALLAILAVGFGWIHLPRELSGRLPVRIENGSAAFAWASSLFVLEALVIYWILGTDHSLTEAFFFNNFLVIGLTLALYFNYSQNLVIYTDDISLLLKHRTAKLMETARGLRHHVETQEDKLAEQEKILEQRALIIERQRRLEVAAQTAGQAAHDIQNMISPIYRHLEIISRSGQRVPEILDCASKIRKQVDQLHDLNGQLLSLARRGRMDDKPVSLEELCHHLPDLFPGRSLRSSVTPDLWVNGSWSQLSRALANLLINAFEAVGSLDEVELRVSPFENSEMKRCHLGFLEPGSYVLVEVEDRGGGIAPEVVDQIFVPFVSFRGKSHRSGSGLGLSIVAAVMEDHRGIIDLRTSAEGTCFQLYLPRVQSPSGALSGEVESHDAVLLLIDDDSIMLDRCKRILESVGYEVIAVSHGREALRALQIEHVDVLILDLKLPDMSGEEIYYAAMHLRPGIRALVHSHYISEPIQRELQKLGVSAFLEKPTSPSELLQAIRRELSQKSKGACQPVLSSTCLNPEEL